MLLNCGVGENSWESLGLQGDPTSPLWKKSVPNNHWKYWCWGWNSNTLVTWCKNWLIGKDADAGKDWRQEKKAMTKNETVWWPHQLEGHEFEQASGWRTGRPGVLYSMGSQRVKHDWATELNWTEYTIKLNDFLLEGNKEVTFDTQIKNKGKLIAQTEASEP